ERGEENPRITTKTKASNDSTCARPRASTDERTPGILRAREDPLVPVRAFARLPLLHRRQSRKAKRDFPGQQGTSRRGEMCVRHNRESPQSASQGIAKRVAAGQKIAWVPERLHQCASQGDHVSFPPFQK